MKPIIIYTLPRTKGTAILQATKRSNQYCESLASREIYRTWYPDVWKKFCILKEPWHLWYQYDKLLTSEVWKQIVEPFDKSDSAVKLFPDHIHCSHFVRDWFETATETESHTVYIATRSSKESWLSYVIAKRCGWNKNFEIPSEPFYTTQTDIAHIADYLDKFERYFPTKGTIIDFDNLPSADFDKRLITLKLQNSHLKYNLIQNRDEFEEQLQELLDYYEPMWKKKAARLIQQSC